MRRAIVWGGLCAPALLLGAGVGAHADQSWRVYHNATGNYSISYPDYWIRSSPPNDANDVLLRAPDAYAFVIGSTLRKAIPQKQWNAAISSVILAGGKPEGKITYGQGVI